MKQALKNVEVRKVLVALVGGGLAVAARALGITLGTPELNEAAAVLVAVGLAAVDHVVRTNMAAPKP